MPNAVVMTGYGPPEVLKWAEVPLAEPGEGQIRIKVKAAGISPTDLALQTPVPHLACPIAFGPRAGTTPYSESSRKPPRKRRNTPPSRVSGGPGGGASGSSRPMGSS